MIGCGDQLSATDVPLSAGAVHGPLCPGGSWWRISRDSVRHSANAFLPLLAHDTRLGRSIQHLLTLPHGLGWSQSEAGEVLRVSVSLEGLGEDICGVLVGWNTLQGDCAELYVLASEVVLDVDMLGPSMLLWVMCQRNAAGVVAVELGW